MWVNPATGFTSALLNTEKRTGCKAERRRKGFNMLD